MWTQYTRITNARPGWALGAMFLAFGGTLALASWTIHFRQAAAEQVLPGWPIKFTLPTPYRWTSTPSPPEMDEPGRLSGIQFAVYRGHDSGFGNCLLQVMCDRESDTSTTRRVGNSLLSLVGVQEPIKIGPIEGYLIEEASEDGPTLTAQGTRRDGLQVVVIVRGDAGRRRLKTALTSVCHSVKVVEPEAEKPH